METADCILQDCQRRDPLRQGLRRRAGLAFLDIAPVAPGHVLVIPKAHHADLFALPDSLGAALLAAQKRVGRAILAAMGATGLNVQQNNAASAGRVVFHVHYHLIPRREVTGCACGRERPTPTPPAWPPWPSRCGSPCFLEISAAQSEASFSLSVKRQPVLTFCPVVPNVTRRRMP